MRVFRVVLTVVGVALLAAALILFLSGGPVAAILWLLGIGLVLTLSPMFERVHYKRLKPEAPGEGWVATQERFVDPTSGRMVEVHVKPKTGERAYVDLGPVTPSGCS